MNEFSPKQIQPAEHPHAYLIDISDEVFQMATLRLSDWLNAEKARQNSMITGLMLIIQIKEFLGISPEADSMAIRDAIDESERFAGFMSPELIISSLRRARERAMGIV